MADKKKSSSKYHTTKDGRRVKKGLYYNINKKRKEGKKMRKKGAKGAPKFVFLVLGWFCFILVGTHHGA